MADGPVVAVIDGLPEQVPGRAPTGLPLDQYGGNHIVQDIGDGNYAFYAHLKTGSVKVKVGDQLTAGQVIAALGNTGNSDAPHLHFHVMSTPDPLRSNGLPFVFKSFRLDSRVASQDALDPLRSGKPAPMQPGFAASRRNRRQPTGSRRDDLCRRSSDAGRSCADVVCVLVFCTIGRRSHAEGLTVVGVAETAWPFLAGTAVGWLLIRGWRRPTAVVPTGVTVWVCTVAVGMLLRKATSGGVAVSFVVVASAVTAVLLLGWRAVAAVLQRRRLSPGQSNPTAAQEKSTLSGWPAVRPAGCRTARCCRRAAQPAGRPAPGRAPNPLAQRCFRG